MSKVTKIKVKQPDGSFSNDIDLGAKASNITLEAGMDLETKLGEMNSNLDNFETYKTTTDKRLDDIETKMTTISISLDGLEKSHDEFRQVKDSYSTIIENIMTTIYRPMGSVANYEELLTKTETAQVGDVWDVLDTGKNYAFTADQEWDDLGGNVDMSQYYTSAYTDEYFLKKTDAQMEYASLSDFLDMRNHVLTDDGGKTVEGELYFNKIPKITCSEEVNNPEHAVNKWYVDNAITDAGFAKIEKADSEEDALSKSQSNPNTLYYWTE